jgi:hypothetical protein
MMAERQLEGREDQLPVNSRRKAADVMGIRDETSGDGPRESTKRGWDNIFRCTLNIGTFPLTPT